LYVLVLEQNLKTIIGILSSYRSTVRKLDLTGMIQDVWELKRVSWIHDMVMAAEGERIVAVGVTESRPGRHSIAESAIVSTWKPCFSCSHRLTNFL
jgi:hypothetical protein